jgi:hypothetical protein
MHIYTDVYGISAYKISVAQLHLLFSYRRQTVSEVCRGGAEVAVPLLNLQCSTVKRGGCVWQHCQYLWHTTHSTFSATL